MRRYLNNSKATAETIDKEGWLHTGDVAYVDADGYYYIVDRVKELIKVSESSPFTHSPLPRFPIPKSPPPSLVTHNTRTDISYAHVQTGTHPRTRHPQLSLSLNHLTINAFFYLSLR